MVLTARARSSALMLVFSIGPINCTGELFSQTQMKVYLTIVSRRFLLQYPQIEQLELDAGENLRASCDFLMLPPIKAYIHLGFLSNPTSGDQELVGQRFGTSPARCTGSENCV